MTDDTTAKASGKDAATESASHDLVAQTFAKMRSQAESAGYKPPSLQRSPRKNSGWSLEAASTRPNTLGESDVAGDGKPVVRDIAGTRVPDQFLYSPGIKIWRKKDRSPVSIGSVLAKQSTERGWHRNIAHGVIMTKWPEIVGSVVAEHTEVREFKDSTVIVQCSSSAWATQLRLAQATVLKNIAEAVGDGIVDELKIYGPQAPSWRKGRFHVKGRGPRDTYG